MKFEAFSQQSKKEKIKKAVLEMLPGTLSKLKELGAEISPDVELKIKNLEVDEILTGDLSGGGEWKVEKKEDGYNIGGKVKE
ncbi:hypothetical protein ISS03_02815 [Patescibacteria group bacterium]|nr:hypothetical protein [Patescibacteria group bacterium]